MKDKYLSQTIQYICWNYEFESHHSQKERSMELIQVQYATKSARKYLIEECLPTFICDPLKKYIQIKSKVA
jgi:hypothetical protein